MLAGLDHWFRHPSRSRCSTPTGKNWLWVASLMGWIITVFFIIYFKTVGELIGLGQRAERPPVRPRPQGSMLLVAEIERGLHDWAVESVGLAAAFHTLMMRPAAAAGSSVIAR